MRILLLYCSKLDSGPSRRGKLRHPSKEILRYQDSSVTYIKTPVMRDNSFQVILRANITIFWKHDTLRIHPTRLGSHILASPLERTRNCHYFEHFFRLALCCTNFATFRDMLHKLSRTGVVLNAWQSVLFSWTTGNKSFLPSSRSHLPVPE